MHTKTGTRLKRFTSGPVLSLSLALVALGLASISPLAEWMEYHRGAIQVGQVWRLVMGHLTHWNADHLVWDVLMFTLLAVMIEQLGRRQLVQVLAVSVGAISACLWFCRPEVETYRGLSGVDSALYAFVGLALIAEAREAKRPRIVALISALGLGMAVKIAWEVATGTTWFVDSAAAGFTPLPLVHAIGAAAGVSVWVTGWWARRSLGQPSSGLAAAIVAADSPNVHVFTGHSRRSGNRIEPLAEPCKAFGRVETHVSR